MALIIPIGVCWKKGMKGAAGKIGRVHQPDTDVAGRRSRDLAWGRGEVRGEIG
jgi:hypothetical protein